MKKHLDECGFRNYLVLHPAIDYCHKYFNYEDEYQDLKPIFDKIYAGLHHDDRDVFNQLIDGRTVGLDNMDSKVGVPVYDFYPNIKPVYLDFINENVIETAILAGVFNGDSALLLINGLPELKMLYGFEPHKKNYDESPLKDEIEATGKVTIIGKGLWDKNATLWLTGESSSSQVVLEKSQGAVEVELVKIDDFMLSVKNKLDYLVLDVEGAELNVLKGAINTLKKDRPQLAISAYHSRFDMFEIPLFLMENLERYVFRLGHYTKHYGETVFYAIPEECFDKGDVI
jgi:FkbM family methyltransferase